MNLKIRVFKTVSVFLFAAFLRCPAMCAGGGRIGFYSGSFDPPTIAHKAIIDTALDRYKLDKIYVLVNKWSGKNYKASIHERMRMMELMMAERKSAVGIAAVYDDEKNIFRGQIAESEKPSRMFVFLGQDSFDSLPDAVRKESGLTFVVVPRPGGKSDLSREPGVEIMDIKGISDISSTKVRASALSEQIDDSLLDPAVVRYIAGKGLYKPAPAGLENLDKQFFETSVGYVREGFKTSFPELDLSKMPSPEYLENQSAQARVESIIRTAAGSSGLEQGPAREFVRKATSLLLREIGDEPYPGIFFLSGSAPTPSGEQDCDMISRNEIRLSSPAANEYRMDVPGYVSMRIPEAVQRFVRENNAGIYLHSGGVDAAFACHIKDGFTKFYYINSPSPLRKNLLAEKADGKEWRLVFAGIYGRERLEHLKLMLSLFADRAVLVEHKKTARDELAASLPESGFGAGDTVIVGESSSFLKQAGAALGLDCKTAASGEVQWRWCSKPGEKNVLALLPKVYGDDLKTALELFYSKGARKFIYTGTAGALDPALQIGDTVIPVKYISGNAEKTDFKNSSGLCLAGGETKAMPLVTQSSVSSPLEESVKKLVWLKARGVQTVDVETGYAAAFASSHPDAEVAVFSFISDHPLDGLTLEKAMPDLSLKLTAAQEHIRKQCLEAVAARQSMADGAGPLNGADAAPLHDAAADDPILRGALKRRQEENAVVLGMLAIRKLRAMRRPPTGEEAALIRQAEALAVRGVPLPGGYKPISRFGHRPHQTMLSVADPGQGHLDVTTRDAGLLQGVILHQEYINRPDMDVAPYRMISPRLNALLRLHAADDAPVTVYYGRPNYQASVKSGEAARTEKIADAFRTDPVTPVHGLAAAAASVFGNGTADVKVAMDGLTTSQILDLMRRVAGETIRSDDQFFSAAFNLNQPLVDDRAATAAKNGKPQILTDPVQIAMLAVELVKAGGWNKVALDSASDKFPSTPVTDLLGPDNLIRWVHAAHSAGLETYTSGGVGRGISVTDPRFTSIVYAGVDGLGLGFSMHFYGPAPGVAGAMNPARLKDAIEIRDRIELTVRGIGAKLLAQLDSEYADKQGILTPKAARLREDLLAAMINGEETKVADLTGQGRVLGFLRSP